ncbi:hypothetical protein [Maribacter sp. 4G9]|uniref:hypothetical protein n=1 Tax=Maribacter sp. 4G9 TaxID=1889777 RepID=UPI000C69FD73|nr:hypothetical protein [Maribacter sp. 4G9]PIB38412.1 hypothetical protein BFP75_16015 [Maribacter sp. 4G9]
MKKVIVMALLSLLFSNSGYSQGDIAPSKQLVEFLDKFRKDYEAMYQQGNFGLVQDRYGENVRLMPEFQETVLGLIPTALYYKSFFERFNVDNYSSEQIEILDLGTHLVEFGSFLIGISDNEDEHQLNGKYQRVWELTKKDDYELVTEAWNYDNWVDFGDKLRFKDVPSVRMALEPHILVNDNISLEIEALNCLMEKVIMEGDTKRWSMFYSKDAMLIGGFSPIAKGSEAIEEYLVELQKEEPLFEELDVRTDRIVELKNHVLEYGSAIESWRDDFNSGISTSKNLRLWKREPNGSLKIFRMMNMYD